MGGHTRKGARVGLSLLRSRCQVAVKFAWTSHQLLNMDLWTGSQCNSSFLEAQFCRVGPDPKVGAVGRRLTALHSIGI